MSLRIELEHEQAFPPRPELVDWLVDHGITPKSLPLRSTIIISRGQVNAEQYVCDDRGRIRLGDDGNPVRTTVTAPLLRPYPRRQGDPT